MKAHAWTVDLKDDAEPSIKTQEKFAEDLIALIERTFHRAFVARINGVTQEQMIIEHDIEAAYRCIDKTIAETGRLTIQSAVKAVDARVPFNQAHDFLINQLKTRVARIINRNNKKKASKRAVD